MCFNDTGRRKEKWLAPGKRRTMYPIKLLNFRKIWRIAQTYMIRRLHPNLRSIRSFHRIVFTQAFFSKKKKNHAVDLTVQLALTIRLRNWKSYVQQAIRKKLEERKRKKEKKIYNSERVQVFKDWMTQNQSMKHDNKRYLNLNS